MTTQTDRVPPGHTRQLGRPRRYTATDMPARMHNWHAPRANRWELVRIVAGAMETQWLGATGVRYRQLRAGDRQWIAPGNRWRVAETKDDLHFELEIHADETVAADSPQVARAALLDGVSHARADSPADLKKILDRLGPGELKLLVGHLDCNAPLQEAMKASNKTLCWHPLEVRGEQFSALIVRSSRRVGLAEYLGRDHAVIEAALSGALRGNPNHARWLHHVLTRHLFIEEQCLFPAYQATGGQTDLVPGLLHEHKLLRRHLPKLNEARSRRRFLLVMEAHDEKEEQIVYPDILKHLPDGAGTLAETIMQHPLAPEPARVEQPPRT